MQEKTKMLLKTKVYHVKNTHMNAETGTKGKKWGGSLRDDPNNGCEGDYHDPELNPFFLRKDEITLQSGCLM